MSIIRKSTPPDQIPGYDKAYWHAKTPQERLDAAVQPGMIAAYPTKANQSAAVHKFRTAADWQAFKEERQRK